MACFWQGILERLTPDERQTCGPGPNELKSYFKRANQPSRRCKWQGSLRTDNELREAVEWIRSDTAGVNQGHDTSTCDPYLCLLVELLGVDVVHHYCGSTIRYEFARGDTSVVPRTLVFRSDRGHFWAA